MELQYSNATGEQLDLLLTGKSVGPSLSLRELSVQGPPPGAVGVIYARNDSDPNRVRPLVLIGREDDLGKLCARYAQLRSDLSPLSVWCHLVAPSFFDQVDAVWHEARMDGLETAWAGLAIAEALMVSETPINRLRLQTCLVTQTFLVARTQALWKQAEVTTVMRRRDTAYRLLKASNIHMDRFRSSLMPIWDCLSGLSDGGSAPVSGGERFYPLLRALAVLRESRRWNGEGPATLEFATALGPVVPEAGEFYSLEQQAPEARLRLFDRLIGALDKAARDDREATGVRRHGLALLAGYLATVAAGGAPSLALLEKPGLRFPELVGWAYVAGSIGEQVSWTSGFDGLGRLVTREMMRPLRLDEAPECDFAFEEAKAVVDAQLGDPLVRLRIKQNNAVSVSIFPGVNVPVVIEADEARNRKPAPESAQANSVERIASALFELMRPLVQREIREQLGAQASRLPERSWEKYERKNKRRGSDPELPLTKK
jgi:hypothetical protein